MMRRPVAHLTARGLSAEETSQAYNIVTELELQAAPNLRELATVLEASLPAEMWTRVARLVEIYRDMAIQCAQVALGQGLKQGATDFLDRMGPPAMDVSSDLPSEQELKHALAEARVANRMVNLGARCGLDPIEVVYAQAVGAAVEARYQTQDDLLLQHLVAASDAVREGNQDRQVVDSAFNELADVSNRKAAEMLVAAYAAGRVKGERVQWERIRQNVLEIW